MRFIWKGGTHTELLKKNNSLWHDMIVLYYTLVVAVLVDSLLKKLDLHVHRHLETWILARVS